MNIIEYASNFAVRFGDHEGKTIAHIAEVDPEYIVFMATKWKPCAPQRQAELYLSDKSNYESVMMRAAKDHRLSFGDYEGMLLTDLAVIDPNYFQSILDWKDCTTCDLAAQLLDDPAINAAVYVSGFNPATDNTALLDREVGIRLDRKTDRVEEPEIEVDVAADTEAILEPA